MGEREEAIIETKLGILIGDFQRFRDEQRLVNKETRIHAEDETSVQAKILSTLKWHTVIGSFMMGTIILLALEHIQ
jgi:hypothetical protein